MPIEKLRPSFTFTEDRIAELHSVVPEAFADGKVNWDVLREALGSYLEEDEQDVEHFGLSWPGKREARRLATAQSRGTLIPQPSLGVNTETARNVFIEGDNLEVLKLLYKSYSGRIKMMYIDPPYNTGNDLVYPDDYSEPLESYLHRVGTADEEGRLLTTNTRASGRFHSSWLNMMYPRLLLARELLREDGVIYVSIDDNEFHNLRLLMNEVFGEGNYVATIIWQKMDSPSRNDANRAVSVYHEYILAYARDIDSAKLYQKSKPSILDAYPFKLPDGRLARRRQLRKNGKGARREDRPTLWYPLVAPDGSTVYPIAPEGWEGRWVLSESTWKEREDAGLTEWIKRDYGWVPYYIETAPDDPSIPWPTLWTDVDQNRQAKAKYTELMGAEYDFDNPKPVDLIRELLRMSTNEDCICMDFFAGSCSTAHAVLEHNRATGSEHKFIVVQLPEPVRGASNLTIADIGRERLRRVIDQVNTVQEDALSSLAAQDVGFQSLKLDKSHFQSWMPYEGDREGLQLQFSQMETPLIPGWQLHELIVEIMLLEGFPLDSEIQKLDIYVDNQVYLVTSEMCAHSLLVCLDTEVQASTIGHLDLGLEEVFVCLDTALTDQDKLRLADQCNLKVI